MAKIWFVVFLAAVILGLEAYAQNPNWFSGLHLFAPKQWEYRIESPPDASFTTDMNRFGSEGWELVSARRATSGEYDHTSSYEVILKREKR
jgi:hypothetical protein